MLVAHSCQTLCNPKDYSPTGYSVLGILQGRILEWVSIPFSRGSSWPRAQTQASRIVGRFFTIWATREALSQSKPCSSCSRWDCPEDARPGHTGGTPPLHTWPMVDLKGSAIVSTRTLRSPETAPHRPPTHFPWGVSETLLSSPWRKEQLGLHWRNMILVHISPKWTKYYLFMTHIKYTLSAYHIMH